ncbi:hypothetical protein KR222_000319 [Zaprionus bogoriensis]|nr:hypothetical protein KR222_000319 [Zaprionus bogoriensis]
MGASTVIVATGYDDERGKNNRNSKNFMQAFQPGRAVPAPFSHQSMPQPQHQSQHLPLPLHQCLHQLLPLPTSRPLQAHSSPAEWQHYESSTRWGRANRC